MMNHDQGEGIREKLDQGEGIREKLRFSLIKLLSDSSRSVYSHTC
jgi:hypothetical protein